jgi:hypothetical protein
VVGDQLAGVLFGWLAFAEVVVDAAEQQREPADGDQQLPVLARSSPAEALG